MRIIVDADATPRTCLKIVIELAAQYGWEVTTVASINHRIDSPDHRVVGDEPQAADLAVMNLAKTGDVVVTQDHGLAAMVLSKGTMALAPSGLIYDNERMTLMLEERNELARWRRGGGRTKGPAPRSNQDDQKFRASLSKLLTS